MAVINVPRPPVHVSYVSPRSDYACRGVSERTESYTLQCCTVHLVSSVNSYQYRLRISTALPHLGPDDIHEEVASISYNIDELALLSSPTQCSLTSYTFHYMPWWH